MVYPDSFQHFCLISLLVLKYNSANIFQSWKSSFAKIVSGRRGYFVESVGYVDEGVIRKYIDEQSK